MKIKTFQELFVYELCDMLSGEVQLTKALNKMAHAATNYALSTSFKSHLKETEIHVARLRRIIEIYDFKASSEKCDAMKGLIEETEEILKKIEDGPVLDAALIAAAQKVEHYEIATYGTLSEMARHLGLAEAAAILAETLSEEKATDLLLTELAEKSINEKARRIAA